MTLMENVMKRQSYSYCGLPPCEKLFGLSSKRSLVREREPWHGQGLAASRTDSLTSVIEMPEENCIRIK